jgi:hypothetical protein
VTRTNLLRGLVFALVAGSTSVPWVLMTAVTFGYAGAAALWSFGAVVVYPWIVSSGPRTAARASLLSLLLGIPVLLLFSDPAIVAALSLVTLGLLRGACLFPRPFGRALAYELVWSGLGALAALTLYDDGLVGAACAVWAYWLVQAGFTLSPSSTEKPRAETDAFERAHRAALGLLDRAGRVGP